MRTRWISSEAPSRSSIPHASKACLNVFGGRHGRGYPRASQITPTGGQMLGDTLDTKILRLITHDRSLMTEEQIERDKMPSAGLEPELRIHRRRLSEIHREVARLSRIPRQEDRGHRQRGRRPRQLPGDERRVGGLRSRDPASLSQDRRIGRRSGRALRTPSSSPAIFTSGRRRRSSTMSSPTRPSTTFRASGRP